MWGDRVGIKKQYEVAVTTRYVFFFLVEWSKPARIDVQTTLFDQR